MSVTKTRSRQRLSGWLLKLRGNERALDRAKLLIDKGNREEALRFLGHSAEVFSGCNKLKCEAATFLFGLGEHEMAIHWLRRGGIEELSESIVFERATEIENDGKLPLAIELLRLHLDRSDHPPQHDPSEIHFLIARLYRILGEEESAVEHVSLCLETGNYPNVLSMVCSMKSEKERALLLDRVDHIKPVAELPGHFSARLNFAISDIYKNNGDFHNSAIHLRKARDEYVANGQASNVGSPIKPSFLIIGTMKSGTTAFYHTLCQHPQVHASVRKEVRYFGDPSATDDWYFAHFPRIPDDQVGITGEATPNYYALDVQDQIERTLPGVKFICLMRDPAKRAVSQYFHGLRHGAIKRSIDKFFDQRILDQLATKSEAELEEITKRAGEGDLFYTPTVVFGMYVHYLRKWFQRFDADRFLLLTLEQFSSHQNATLDRTCDFLNIDRPGSLELMKPHRGVYNSGDEQVEKVLRRLEDFYAIPNKKLFDEFGIQFSETC